MKIVKVAVIQMNCIKNREANIQRAIEAIESAASRGANIILLQELFETPYFCQNYDASIFSLAVEYSKSTMLSRMSEIAKKLKVVLPISFFEISNNCFYNSVAVIDANGKNLGVYRKTHIPDDPGYYEKFYFTPGDTGFKVWDTRFGKIGVGICWDQWFPEAARIMSLKGAELLLYPTAIGFHTNGLTKDCSDHWMLVMRGHAACNMIPVMASNRIGIEKGQTTEINFFGRSFITDGRGKILEEASRDKDEILLAELDLDTLKQERNGFVLFRDRRPEMYGDILSKDGSTRFLF